MLSGLEKRLISIIGLITVANLCLLIGVQQISSPYSYILFITATTLLLFTTVWMGVATWKYQQSKLTRTVIGDL